MIVRYGLSVSFNNYLGGTMRKVRSALITSFTGLALTAALLSPQTALAAEAGGGSQPPGIGSTITDGSNARTASAASPSFYTNGDYVHISGTAPRQASGHGWWTNNGSPATTADITIQLQVLNGGVWYNVGPLGVKRGAFSGGGSANRASTQVTCANTLNVNWRSVVDVDINGYIDSDEKLYTPAQILQCGL